MPDLKTSPDQQLARLFEADGPFVSAYLESPSEEENAAFHLTTRWKTMRSSLAAEGADDPTLEAMDEAIGVDSEAVEAAPSAAADNAPAREVDAAADHRGGPVLAVIAAGGEVLHREHLPAVHGAGGARFGPVPWVTPLFDAAEQDVPYVVVLADRTGADLHGAGSRRDIDETVEGSHDQIERNAPGGWSQRRYQQRAIDSWEHNAKEVAQAAEALCERLDARVLLVGGDEHAVSPFLAALGHPWSERAHTLEHGTRAAGGDDAMLEDEIRRLVRTVAAEDEVALLERFKQLCGQGQRAANGAAAVVAALQAAMVDTLLLHDRLDDDRVAWFGPEANLLATDQADLAAMGVESPEQGRLVDLAVRAALGTGATCRLVPSTAVEDGLGAILRG